MRSDLKVNASSDVTSIGGSYVIFAIAVCWQTQ